MRDRPIPISHLAAYAADPNGFRARRGAAVSPEAADFGERYHRAFGRPAPRGRVLVWLAVAAAGLVAALVIYDFVK
jgi:RecB family exonuclease